MFFGKSVFVVKVILEGVFRIQMSGIRQGVIVTQNELIQMK